MIGIIDNKLVFEFRTTDDLVKILQKFFYKYGSGYVLLVGNRLRDNDFSVDGAITMSDVILEPSYLLPSNKYDIAFSQDDISVSRAGQHIQAELNNYHTFTYDDGIANNLIELA